MRRFVLEIDLNAVEPGQRHLDQMRIGRSRRIRLDLANRPVQPGAAVAIGFLTAIAQVWSRRSAVHVAMPPLSADPSRTQAGGVSACHTKRFQAARVQASIASHATPSYLGSPRTNNIGRAHV